MTDAPIPLTGLVRSFRADLEGELARLLRAGKTPIDIDLGPKVDVPLLTEHLLAAHVEWVPRQIVILEVFDLGPHDLADPAIVKARYRELVRRFHPDRHTNPGHTSRFLEVQACWAALSHGA